MKTILMILFTAAHVAAACLSVSGDVIRARDLAQAVPAFARVPPESRVGYAPVPGAKRTFRSTDLERIARRLGVSLDQASGVCFEWQLRVPSRDRFRAAIEKSLDLPTAQVEIVETSRQPAPEGELIFPRSALKPPPPGDADQAVTWRGFIEYGENRRFVVWARVRITAKVQRVVTVEPLRAGEPIAAHQVRLETREGFPFADAAAGRLDQVIGQILRRPLTAGATVPAHWLDRALEVEREDVVKVRVRSGAAVIVAEGRAEAGGHRGDTIPVRNPSSGRTFRAKITGPRQVSLTVVGN